MALKSLAKKTRKRKQDLQGLRPIPTDIDSIGNYNLPEVRPGDTLRIKNCGAYTMSLASNWTRQKTKNKNMNNTLPTSREVSSKEGHPSGELDATKTKNKICLITQCFDCLFFHEIEVSWQEPQWQNGGSPPLYTSSGLRQQRT
jgi:hypothetical protein